uniref:Non-lysosomal glucosylceramidase n=1 Tax=Plectus sambesii TaxID=2011161 RepID=A0A914XET7_9BILA
ASSLPTTVFVWEIKNDSENDYDVSITFTFRNGTGDPRWKRESVCQTAVFDNAATAGPDGAFVQGVCLEHKIARMKCTYAIGAVKRPNQAVTICRNFRPCGSGRKLWDSLFAKGQLEGEYDVDGDGRELGVAVCVSAPVPSGKRETMELALAWDMPKVAFGQGGRVYKRRYTRWYGDDCKAGPELCRRALIDYRDWERRIDIWQTPVLNDERLPAWYKSALFNELYFMTDGGSIWFEFDEDWTKLEKQLSPYSIELMRRYGRFGYLESWEYRMVNTYDVHFYASFALAQLWPQLEHALQSEFTDQVEHLDEKSVRYHMEGDWAPTKSRTRVPHDLGNPADDPWLMTNAYVMHDTGKWKDLNLKFILTCYRDYVHILNRDETFLRAVWPAVEDLIREALDHWDHDKDGMIENSGAADQTYDAWKMTGVSAYCGSLWLAALQVARRMAEQLGEVEKAAFYAETLGRARAVYEKKLWNKTYYKFDEHSRSRDTIMADQLCGYWFLDSVCVEDAQQILPLDRVKQALNTIYDYNVCKFAGGRMGAVNGMKPNGTVDRACIQADEVWTGVTYAVAAFLIQQGELEKGFRTASGCYEACFERFGLQYQTPEALYEHRFYRAIGYMRPLSIWAMQWALEKHCGFPSISDILLHEKRIVPDGSDEDVLTDATADLAADTTTTTAAAAEVL